MDYVIKNWWQILLMLPLITAMFVVFVCVIMKDIGFSLFIIAGVMFVMGITNLAKAATFEYKGGLKIEAPSYYVAAKLCYKKLNPIYTCDEDALAAIDICANPIKGEVK